MRTVLCATFLSVLALSAWGQGPPGTNLSVDVRVSRIAARGDTTAVEYVLTNSPTSQEELFGFTVEAPAPITRIQVPEPQEQWTTDTKVKGLSVASWGMLDPQLARGASSPPLVFEAIGLPAIVTYWAEGWFPVPTYEPVVLPNTPPPAREALSANAVTGKTVGVEPFPADVGPANLLGRLRGLSDQACGDLAWITSATLCSGLKKRLEQATQTLAQGSNSGARAQLESFLTELSGQHGPGLPVNDNAYWLLKVNAEFILSRIPASVSTFFLQGSGGTANPPTLALSTTTPTATTAKYQDSPAIKYSGGNPWVTVGTWTAPQGFGSGTLSALGAAQVWLGLKNSDDIGTTFDVRVEAYKNGILVTAGQTLCIQGVTRNPDLAKAVTVAFAPFTATGFGVADVLALKVLNRIGTTAAGAACGGHSNAVGLRLYFDAASRAAQFAATF
jgi:hypothetical protein